MGLFNPNVQKMEKKKKLKGLVKALSHKDKDVRNQATDALRRVGDERCKVLLQELDEIEQSLSAARKKAETFFDIQDAVKYVKLKRKESDTKRERVMKDFGL